MKKSTKKIIFQMAYIFGTLAIIAYITFSDENFQKLGNHLTEFNPWWLMAGVVAILIYWYFQAVILDYVGRLLNIRLKFHRTLKIAMIGEYYSALTPFAMGGQPVQVAYYKGYDIGVAKSTSILALRFIGFEVALCTLFIVCFILQGEVYYNMNLGVFWLSVVGFCINIGVLVFVSLIMVKRAIIENIGLFIIKNLSKIKKLQNIDMKGKFLSGVDDFAAASEVVKNNILKFIIMCLISIAGIVFYFVISYFVYRAVGLNSVPFIQIFSLNVFLYTMVCFFPTPGALGASEGAFIAFYGDIFTSAFVFLGMILWRLLTYYSNLIVGAGMVIIDEIHKMRVEKRKEMEKEEEQNVMIKKE